MTDWREYYKEHLISISEAAKKIVPGDRVWIGQATQIPYALLEEMYTHMNEYDYYDIMLMYNCAVQPVQMLFDPETKKHFRLMSAFCLPLERISGEMGIMEYCGFNYDQLAQGPFVYGANTLAIQICPPDENGYCNVGSYGVSVNKVITQRPELKKKIAFIDPTGLCPVKGDVRDTSIHITEFDYIVENPTELIGVPAAQPQEIDKIIASYILPYIHPGDKIQIGFGGLGEEILANLKSIGNIEVYSEVACDNMAQLCREGVITKITAASPGACSEEFFKFCYEDPRANLISLEYTIEPFEIMKQDNIVAINATFMIDLIGQCCSEAQGLTPYSGTGGSFAYTYGAIRAKGGRSFICLRSTYIDHEGARHSNVVPWLPEGSIVTTLKNFVMYVVTEYGLADIYLKTLRDRIKALIKIAHPDYREWLKEKICTTPLISEEDFENQCRWSGV
ncbi:MAG: hypothetical protein GX488_06455 [Clostridiales bacterium]|nr:hypothetical protein [Clostridiales bacterium]